MLPNQFETMTEALESLKRRSFVNELFFDRTGAYFKGEERRFSPREVTIVEHHRFEGPSSSDDMAVVYAVELVNGQKGLIIDSFGIYANPDIAEFLKGVALKEEL